MTTQALSATIGDMDQLRKEENIRPREPIDRNWEGFLLGGCIHENSGLGFKMADIALALTAQGFRGIYCTARFQSKMVT